MTFAEISSRIQYKLWGGSNPPTNAVTVLEGSEGLIANAHRKLQQNYNYWFMRSWTTIDTIVGVQGYGMPTEFKEIIRCLFKENGEDYFRKPLTPLNKAVPEDQFWQNNNNTAEYPEYYSIVGDDLILYYIPSEIRTLHIIYWTFLARPTVFATDEDSLTKYGADCIIGMAAAEMAKIQQEFTLASLFERELLGNLELLKHEDFRRRQTTSTQTDYKEF